MIHHITGIMGGRLDKRFKLLRVYISFVSSINAEFPPFSNRTNMHVGCITHSFKSVQWLLNYDAVHSPCFLMVCGLAMHEYNRLNRSIQHKGWITQLARVLKMTLSLLVWISLLLPTFVIFVFNLFLLLIDNNTYNVSVCLSFFFHVWWIAAFCFAQIETGKLKKIIIENMQTGI